MRVYRSLDDKRLFRELRQGVDRTRPECRNMLIHMLRVIGKREDSQDVLKGLDAKFKQYNHGFAPLTHDPHARDYEVSVFDLNLSLELKNTLVRDGIRTVEDLVGKYEDELQSNRFIGVIGTDAIWDALAKYGLGLKVRL